MKKIGLITFHNSINYGVYLQAYALQSAVERLDANVEILDYNRFTEGEKQEKNNKTLMYRIRNIRETISVLRLYLFRRGADSRLRARKFNEFAKNHFKVTAPIGSLNELTEVQANYDAFICGSDQIWNPDYTKGNGAYFLAFAPKYKRIAYAPSYGVSDMSLFKDYEELYKKNISEFHALSVRETSAASLTVQLSGREPEVVVDPTLLLNARDWAALETKPEPILGEYVLFYVLGNDRRYVELAKKIHVQYKLQVLVIPNGPIWTNCSFVKRVFAGVDEFLYLIHHAKFVYTDSFHGVAFSVNYRTSFTALKRTDTKHSLTSRLEDFLQSIALNDRCITVDEALNQCMIDVVDYKVAEKKLNEWVDYSQQYLANAIK